MSEYVKIKRKLYDELIDIKAKYVTLCKMLETMQAVYEENKPKEETEDAFWRRIIKTESEAENE